MDVVESKHTNISDILVSVIIPVYNTEKYIQACMESVLGQSHTNLEIILINDGSTDGSAQLCRGFLTDPRVVFVDRENRGLSLSRQQGIDMAQGQFFCNLDSDDLLDLDFVKKMLSRALETGADVVACGRKDFDDGYEKDFLLSADQEFYPLTKAVVSDKFHVLASQLWFADSWNKLYRTEFVKSSGVRYWLNNKYNGTDLSFNHLLCLHCPQIAVVNEPLLLHRIVAGSRVHRKNKPLQAGFQIIAERQIQEADALGYGREFYESYKYAYYALQRMVFKAIVSESESKAELKNRWRDYRQTWRGFAEKYPALSPEGLKSKPCSGIDRLRHKAMLSDNMFWCSCVYLLHRVAQHKDGKRGK